MAEMVSSFKFRIGSGLEFFVVLFLIPGLLYSMRLSQNVVPMRCFVGKLFIGTKVKCT